MSLKQILQKTNWTVFSLGMTVSVLGPLANKNVVDLPSYLVVFGIGVILTFTCTFVYSQW